MTRHATVSGRLLGYELVLPLLPVAAVALAALGTLDAWLAAGLASLITLGQWVTPDLGTDLTLSLIRHGPAAILTPGSSAGLFTAFLVGLAVLELVVLIAAGMWIADRGRLGDPRRSLLRRGELADLAGRKAIAKAVQLRPSLAKARTVTPADQGVRVLRLGGRDVYLSWEDVALAIMGPRANKTSALAVPTVLSAPGLVVATSNKADLWALTAGPRARVGPVWTFDPQEITFGEQGWWWDPLDAIATAPTSMRVEAAARLAGHFSVTIDGQRKDPFFSAAGEQVLTATLLAAALSGRTLRDVVLWLTEGSREAITALDAASAHAQAADLEATLAGAEVTAKGIYQTARTAIKCLASERVLRWVTPPHTWQEPPSTPHRIGQLRPWELLASDESPTIHLLSKEGAGTAAPVVAALVDRLFEVGELAAQANGGRLDPPLVAVLDEAANICPIKQLPQFYSHFGSRGMHLMTMLQSYQQGVGVWGPQGMDALWSAATIKLVGAGVDDHEFLRKLSGLIGQHDVPKISVSHDRMRGASRQWSTTREPVMAASDLRALPKTQAVLLATGRRVGVGDLLPWYHEEDARDVRSYQSAALTQVRRSALDWLGPDNPVAAALGDPDGARP